MGTRGVRSSRLENSARPLIASKVEHHLRGHPAVRTSSIRPDVTKTVQTKRQLNSVTTCRLREHDENWYQQTIDPAAK